MALKIAEWRADPADPTAEAHAYPALGPTEWRGFCGTGRQLPFTIPVTAGRICPVCTEVVAGAAFAALEEVTTFNVPEVR